MAEAVAPDFLDLLRCPRCVHGEEGSDDPRERGRLDQGGEDNGWLVCRQCGLRYPIEEGFPVLLADEALAPETGADPRSS